MAEFRPGVPTAIFAKLDAQMKAKGRIAIAPVADGIVAQARINASNGKHAPHTPTPSSGNPTGPAIISGTLVKSIDRTPVTRIARGWLCQVGVRPGETPAMYNNGPRPSSTYAKILELEGVRSGRRFPFLYPAALFGFEFIAPAIYSRMYGEQWARIA
jgi:hypothetical protein